MEKYLDLLSRRLNGENFNTKIAFCFCCAPISFRSGVISIGFLFEIYANKIDINVRSPLLYGNPNIKFRPFGWLAEKLLKFYSILAPISGATFTINGNAMKSRIHEEHLI